jgi:hypothetical protein
MVGLFAAEVEGCYFLKTPFRVGGCKQDNYTEHQTETSKIMMFK